MELVQSDDIITWRKKYHSLPMGHQRSLKLYEVYKQSLLCEGRGKTLHLIGGNLVCRYGVGLLTRL